ncbi:MAG: type IV pilus biogenesis/stability protein PilW [Nitrosomonadales bacterium]|nr:type IV pilus biogenesis/stability protein PilW [Nitrosomonadales bacterium]
MNRVLILSFVLLAGCAAGGRTGFEQAKNVNASAKVHTELAGMYYERAQLGVALGEIEQALQADRNYAPAYNVRGLVNLALREYKEAEQDFQQSLSLDKNDSDTHNNYGWFLCQRGREKESIAHFMAAIKNPLYATPERAYLNAGVCAKKAGDSKDAEEFLQRALLVQPGLTDAMLPLAELNFANGDYVTAKKYFAGYSEKAESLTAEQLWLAVRIERKVGDRNSEASYSMQLRKRYPDARETQLLTNGE